jgi:heat-inducible transcriptional repressor
VTSPHTSAGKVPTVQGIRFFVDSLIRVQPLEPESLDLLQGELGNPERTSRELVATASNLLSGITRMAGVVTLPRREIVTLRQVEFLPLAGNRILVILVVNEKEVENRIIRTERQYEQAELQQAANFVNEHFGGESVHRIRDRLLADMADDKARMNALMQEMLEVAANVFREDAEREPEYVVAGEGNLLNFVSGEDMDMVRGLFEAFGRKRDVLHLLDRCLEAEGIHLFIGDESGYRPFMDYSVVTAPYEVDGRPAGVLGVIGPTRMAYQRVIPVVDATARLLSAAMRHLH